MLETYRKEWVAYVNSRWAWRIFKWSAIALVIACLGFVLMLGFGNHNGGTGTNGGKVAGILSLAIAIPVILVFNLAIALIWVAIKAARRLAIG